jgi:hypothetical protein
VRVLRVTWKDAMLRGNDWLLLDELESNAPGITIVVSYGWEVTNEHHQIILATSRAGADTPKEQLSGFIAIPRSAVQDVTVLVP